jgi:hypothetical protein
MQGKDMSEKGRMCSAPLPKTTAENYHNVQKKQIIKCKILLLKEIIVYSSKQME